MRWGRALLAAIAAVGSIAVMLTSGSVAAATQRYQVMNTSEQPPDGVYFRSDTNMASAVRITGFGVYMNEYVDARCYKVGEPVGPYSNNIWYYALNVSRPTVAGRSNEGWINTHYVNDGQTAGHPAPGVPSCDAPPAGGRSSGPTASATVYFSPYNSASDEKKYTGQTSTVADKTLYFNEWWKSSDCTLASAPTQIGSSAVKTLAGFSKGRSGPLTLLRTRPNDAKAIDYIVLFDPGTLKEFKSSCKAGDVAQALASWLDSNRNARLLIFAGKDTLDYDSRVTINGRTYYHQGRQQVLFPKVRGTTSASRVTVCNYDAMTHEKVRTQFESWIKKPPVVDSCPTSPNGTAPNATWHP